MNSQRLWSSRLELDGPYLAFVFFQFCQAKQQVLNKFDTQEKLLLLYCPGLGPPRTRDRQSTYNSMAVDLRLTELEPVSTVHFATTRMTLNRGAPVEVLQLLHATISKRNTMSCAPRRCRTSMDPLWNPCRIPTFTTTTKKPLSIFFWTILIQDAKKITNTGQAVLVLSGKQQRPQPPKPPPTRHTKAKTGADKILPWYWMSSVVTNTHTHTHTTTTTSVVQGHSKKIGYQLW